MDNGFEKQFGCGFWHKATLGYHTQVISCHEPQHLCPIRGELVQQELKRESGDEEVSDTRLRS